MKQFGGWYFPEGEEHLVDHMSRAGKSVNGRISYQYEKMKMALEYVKSWRRAVDVGGHVGLWTYYLTPHFDYVEVFEPVPQHQECFTLNITSSNVTLHPYALGASEGVITMTRYPGNSGHSHVSGVGDVTSEMRTLDSFNFQDVDFMKIDTEGYELQVLQGAVETLKRCKPVLIVEQKANNGSRYGYDDRAALPFLEKMGAQIVAERARDYVLVWKDQ